MIKNVEISVSTEKPISIDLTTENEEDKKVTSLGVDHTILSEESTDESDVYDNLHPTEDDLFIKAINDRELSEFTKDTPFINKKKLKNFKKLLIDLQLTAEELEKAGIHASAIHILLEQNMFEKFLRFLASVSLLRTVLLLPFLTKNGIKNTKHPIKRSVRTASIQPSLIIEPEENEENIVNNEEINPSDIFFTKEDRLRPTRYIQKKRRFPVPILTTSAILLESESTLQRVLAVGTFQETTALLVSGVWSIFFSSLLINSWFNLALYPEEYPELITLLDKSLYTLNLPKTITDSLKNSLNQPYIWGPLVGVPLLIGTLYAVRAAYQVKMFNHRQIEPTLKYLKDYRPGCWEDLWEDLGGWIVNALIPDLIPKTALFPCLPQHTIQAMLEKIKRAIVWDGRLTPQKKRELFEMLRIFSRKNHKLTQMNGLSTLAGIINNIQLTNLTVLEEEEVDKETIKTLLFIKTEAFRELQFLANNYNLPHQDESLLGPLPRYLHANYLMWMIGHPQHGYLQPLFFAYKGAKLYSTVMFYYAIVTGLLNIHDLYIEEQECLATGKQWLWMKELAQYDCSVCGDYSIFYKSIFTIEDCFSSYLAMPRAVEELRMFISNRKNLTSFDLSKIKTLDLSSQILLLQNQTLLSAFLQELKPKMTGMQTVNFQVKYPGLNIDFSEGIANFIQNSSVTTLTFAYSNFSQEGFDLLAKVLPHTQINYLVLTQDWSPPNPAYNITLFAQALQYSVLTNLFLVGGFVDDEAMQVIANALPSSPVIELILGAVNSSSSLGCIALAEKLPQSRLQYLQFFGRYYYSNSFCMEALTNASTRVAHDFTLELIGTIKEMEIKALARTLAKNPTLPLRLLYLYILGGVSQEAMIDLIQAVPSSLLESLVLEGFAGPGYNYSVIIPQVAHALSRSKVTEFGWTYGGINFGDENAKLFASFLPTHMRKLTLLNLSGNNIGKEGMQAIAPMLNKTDIQFLALGWNNIGTGLEHLVQVLPETNISTLDLAYNHIDSKAMSIFVKLLNQSKIETLYLEGNDIDDDVAYLLITEGLPGSQVIKLPLASNNITNNGAQAIANFLSTRKLHHGLWIDEVNTNRIRATAFAQMPKLKLIELLLEDNYIGNEGALALCQILPETNFLYDDIVSGLQSQRVSSDKVKPSTLLNCGVFSSANFLRPAWPWLALYRIYHTTKHAFLDALFSKFDPALTLNKFHPEPKPKSSQITSVPVLSSCFTAPAFSALDASTYPGNELIRVNLNVNLPIQSCVGDKPLALAPNMRVFKSAAQSNHILWGGDETVFDMTQSHGVNLLRAGKNNKFQLGFWSKDHVVVTESQEILHIQGFNGEDTLHIIDPQYVYPSYFAAHCHDEISVNEMPMAVIKFKGTDVQLMETTCKSVTPHIVINDDVALNAAQMEVLRADSTVNTHSAFYANLLTLSEGFIHAVGHSALLTAIPMLVTEIFYRYGGHSRQEAEVFGQEIQRDLILSFAGSPYAITANYLASWLASRLTKVPHVISIASIGASLITSALEILLTQNVSFGWVALQTGFAFMGTVLGSYAIKTLPEASQQGMDTARQVSQYFNNKMSFWSENRASYNGAVEKTAENLPSHLSDARPSL